MEPSIIVAAALEAGLTQLVKGTINKDPKLKDHFGEAGADAIGKIVKELVNFAETEGLSNYTSEKLNEFLRKALTTIELERTTKRLWGLVEISKETVRFRKND